MALAFPVVIYAVVVAVVVVAPVVPGAVALVCVLSLSVRESRECVDVYFSD